MKLFGGSKFLLFLGLLLVVGLYISYKLRVDLYVKFPEAGQVWKSDNSLMQQLRDNRTVLTKMIPAENRKTRMCVLFSTWVAKPHKRTINDNTLRMWRVWKPDILPLLFSDEEEERQRAKHYGWTALPPPSLACGGVPVFRDMFQATMAQFPDVELVGFANGDLLFGVGLHETLRVVSRDPMIRQKPVMLIARRSNVDFTNRSEVHNLREVAQLVKVGHWVRDGSSDAVFTNRLFPWHRIPDVVPGRLGIFMFLVASARTLNAIVIDITPTVAVIHMTSSGGNMEAWAHNKAFCNRQLVASLGMTPSLWGCGSVDCAEYTTEVAAENNATHVVKKTAPWRSQCMNCRQNMTYFQPPKPSSE